ncbi:MAG: hypothetical protein RL071_1159 [Pseudomonadota bacterium]
MFRELPAAVPLEDEVLRFWDAQGIFQKSLQAAAGRPRFVFYEGPPTANGTPHNGHVLTRVIKDLLPRYKAMRGYLVDRKAGWDTHGLPVEIEVEKELGMRGGANSPFANAREAVLAYGLDKFAQRCIESVFKYTNEWETLTKRVGFWVDLDDAYVTYHRSYVESVWWALHVLFERGLLYQGKKVVWWWPEGGTALSSGEVGEGYRDVDDPSVTVRFPLVDRPEVSVLAWTTTPWTLPSNTALAVNPKHTYAVARVARPGGAEGETELVLMAEALLPQGAGVLERYTGLELEGMRYSAPFSWASPEGGDAHKVVCGPHVALDQTGVVHTAPAYGEDDHRLALDKGIGMLQLVGPDGRFGAEAPEWVRGLHFKEADKHIIRDLRERGLLFKHENIRHSYPFSPRSKDDPLMQLARPGWFIKTTAFKDEALANNAAVHWLPEHIRDGRFGDFLRNNVDWALSRERFWGTPLPIWTCAACGQRQSFPGVAALKAAGATGFDPTVDEHLAVHKPWVDKVTVPCAACGGVMERVSEVIDCWFDSGCMPFAQFGFPHQGVDKFRQSFPADFISEAVDQTRGWFYSLLMISTMVFDEETCRAYGLAYDAEARGLPRPYRNCVVLGHVCDMEGKKESKSSGNYTSPDLVLRGRMKMRVVADPALKPDELGMGKAAVRSIDLGAKERLRMTVGELEEGGLHVTLKEGPHRGKETVALHPDTLAAIGGPKEVWLHAPFEPPGADAFRWLFYAANAPWTNTRLSLRAIREGQREFHIRLGNVYSFFSIYANIAGFDPAQHAGRSSAHVLDRWIRGELDQLIVVMTEHLDGYRIYEAARALSAFVDGLSNWYVRRSRDRFWGDGEAALDALSTLYGVLLEISKLAAPFVPFMAEALYLRLGGAEAAGGQPSVHMEPWPSPGGAADPALSEDMALLRELASLGLSARATVGVKVRQPLRAAEVMLADPARAERLAALVPLLVDELNVREVHFGAEAARFVDFKVKPNYPNLGKRLGKEMKTCAAALSAADPAAVRAGLLAGGFTLTLDSGPVTLSEEDVVVEVAPRAGFKAAGSAAAVVALHADLDDDLREEGLSRELVNRIAGARKDLDLGYTDRIRVGLRCGAAVRAAARRFEARIRSETLAVALDLVDDEQAPADLDGHPFSMTVEKA